MNREEDLRKILHNPEELGKAHYEYAKNIIEHEGLEWPAECMNRTTLPLRPGTMATVLGRPGHGKSTLLGLMGKYHAKKIVEQGRGMDEAVIHVTWEQSVEELETFYQADGEYSVSDIAWGRVPLETIEKRANMRQFLPVHMIGLSVTKRHKNLPRMYLDTVLRAVENLVDKKGITPKLLLMDYIQIIPVAGSRSRVDQVTEVAPRVKEVATRIGAPALVAVQAARRVEERDWRVPKKFDAQWASSIEQASDVMFGIWRPSVDGYNEVPLPSGKEISVDDELLILERLKQRGEKAQARWIMNFNPATLTLSERSTRRERGY